MATTSPIEAANRHDIEKTEPRPSLQLQQQDDDIRKVAVKAEDAVFGAITEDGPNFRNVGWIGTAGLMIKTQMGLGVLSFPSIFHTLGIVPGVLLMCTIAGMTTWSNYIVGVFKLRHPEIYGIDDVGQLLFGRIGKEIVTFAFLGAYILATGSAMLSISICFNALSNHGACTAIFVAVAFIMVCVLSGIRTLGRVSWVAWVGLVGILVAVFIVTIAVAVKGGPNVADGVEWTADYKLFGTPTFAEAMAAISTLAFSYGGTGAFFQIVAEMRDPRMYTRSLVLCQTVVTVTYVVVSVVIYYYCGSHVASPAIGSAGPLFKKIGYGIALPGLLASGTILAHVSNKYLFIRILRGSVHLTSNTWTHWTTWIGCTLTVNIIAYIMASAIPVFNGLVSLAGALFMVLLCFQPMGCMWLYDNWNRPKDERRIGWYCGAGWSIFMIVAGTFLMISGTYGTIVGIIDSYNVEGGSGVWSCSDNSNSS